MEIRPAQPDDLDDIMRIYACAKEYMIAHGNPTQWSGGYPSRELLMCDIAEKRCFVCCADGITHGVFVFIIGPDPTYAVIEDGSWIGAGLYGTIHRIAGDGSGGVFSACLAFCRARIGELRADTHESNKTMQHLLEKAGFERRGVIYVADGTPRIAYQYGASK